MSKELEALNKIKNKKEFTVGFLHNEVGANTFEVEIDMEDEFFDELPIIEKALTPPTQEEVCEALSEYFKEKVSYNKREFKFIKKHMIIGYIIFYNKHNNTYRIEVDLPPHLITLIGRFYEGGKKDE